MSKLLIAIPTKDLSPEYRDRITALQSTWLPSVDHRLFSDADLRLHSDSPTIRQERMKAMCRYALDEGYDHIFRCDTDAYVWTDRLLASDYEHHDYMGTCFNYHDFLARHRTANAGPGFFLSRRAMEVLLVTPFFTQGAPPVFWGDIWCGMALFDAGIKISRTERIKDGEGFEDIRPRNLPDHNLISVHPVTPDGMKEFHGERSLLPVRHEL